MTWLLDHDVPDEIARVLRQDGHDVVLVRDVLSPSAADQEVFRYGCEKRLLLVSCNRDDFVDLASRNEHPGMVILIRRRTRIAECAALLRLIGQAGQSGLSGNINFA